MSSNEDVRELVESAMTLTETLNSIKTVGLDTVRAIANIASLAVVMRDGVLLGPTYPTVG